MEVSFIAFQLSALPPYGYPIRVVWTSPSGEINDRLIRPDTNWKSWDNNHADIKQKITQADVHSAGDSCLDLIDWLNAELYKKPVYAFDTTTSQHCLRLLSAAGERQPEFEITDLPSDIKETCGHELDAEKQVSDLKSVWIRKQPKNKVGKITEATDQSDRHSSSRKPVKRTKVKTNVIYRPHSANDPYSPEKTTGELDFIDAMANHMKVSNDDRYYSLSTAEQLYVALASNRLDLIQAQGETITSALGRIGRDWIEQLVERHRYL